MLSDMSILFPHDEDISPSHRLNLTPILLDYDKYFLRAQCLAAVDQELTRARP